jgi:hypothetical protein
MTTAATTAQVRAYYKAQGYEVRISRNGRVEFRRDGAWLEGRFVSEYRIIDGQVVLV